MIVRLEGTLVATTETSAEIEIEGGITHEVLVAAYLAPSLSPRIGQHVSLFTVEHLEAIGQGSAFIPRLLGFASREHRAIFHLLTTVKGLGSRRVLRVMCIAPEEIARSIAQRDTRALVKLPEIGKKLAEAIVFELGDKIVKAIGPAAGTLPGVAAIEPKSSSLSASAREAVGALVSLGESERDAERMVLRVLEADPDQELAGDAGRLLERALRL